MCDLNNKLYHAIRRGQVDEVKRLIAAGVDVNHVDEFGYSHINWVLGPFSKPNLAIVRLLLDAGADVNHDSGNGSLIYRAASNNNVEMVKLLREYGAKLDITTIMHIYLINPIKNYLSIPVMNFVRKHVDISEDKIEILGGYFYVVACVSLGTLLGQIMVFVLIGTPDIVSFFTAWITCVAIVSAMFGGILWFQRRDK